MLENDGKILRYAARMVRKCTILSARTHTHVHVQLIIDLMYQYCAVNYIILHIILYTGLYRPSGSGTAVHYLILALWRHYQHIWTSSKVTIAPNTASCVQNTVRVNWILCACEMTITIVTGIQGVVLIPLLGPAAWLADNTGLLNPNKDNNALYSIADCGSYHTNVCCDCVVQLEGGLRLHHGVKPDKFKLYGSKWLTNDLISIGITHHTPRYTRVFLSVKS